jgi:hypothetical protein
VFVLLILIDTELESLIWEGALYRVGMRPSRPQVNRILNCLEAGIISRTVIKKAWFVAVGGVEREYGERERERGSNLEMHTKSNNDWI